MPAVRPTLMEVFRFCKRHWVHALLVPPAVIGFTALHESAHWDAREVGAAVRDLVSRAAPAAPVYGTRS